MLTYAPVDETDLDELADLRAEAMEESLTRFGRFDHARARERFIKNFDPPNSSHLLWNGERAGVIVVTRRDDRITLENLYLYKRFHNLGIGSRALQTLCNEADLESKPIHVIVLKDSDAIRFYRRYGFVLQSEVEVDCNFVRMPHMKHPEPQKATQ
jgi:ribosomal protein S18 acetylase RimI-like enzyme